MKNIFLLFALFFWAPILSAQDVDIILPYPPQAAEHHAAMVLQSYLSKMTDQKVSVIAAKSLQKKSIHIFVGKNSKAKKWGIRFPDNLPDDAYFLQGKNGAFAISGGGDMGAEYGVYSFLELLGCRKLSPTDTILPFLQNLQLPVYQAKIEAPAFPYRELWYEPAFDDDWARWHKLKTNTKKNKEWGLFVHTFEKLCPAEKFFPEHPEYFAFNGAQRSPGQLCLSNDTVLQIVMANLQQLIQEKPAAKYWSVSQNDNFDYCKCPRCAAADLYYGGPAGTLLAFVNRVARLFPDITISTLAYQYTRQAPKNIKPGPNVSVCLCSIECNRGQSIEEGCPDFARDVREWSALTKNLMIWDYVVQFRSYVSPFPNWHTLQPNLEFFQKYGVNMMFEQGSGRDRSEFSDMRAYLLAKLMWNPKANMDSILTDFGEGYYGADRPFIGQYIHDQTTRLAKHGNHLWIYDIPQNEPFVKDNFYDRLMNLNPPLTGSSRLKQINAAILPEMFGFMENLKTVPFDPKDPMSEKVVLAFLMDTSEMSNMLAHFAKTCQEAGFKHLNEKGYTPAQYVADYKAYLKKAKVAYRSKAHSPTLQIPASPTYAKGDPNELTNKLVGETDYRSNWLGFQGKDMSATVQVAGDSASAIEVSFLQDQASWVFLPQEVIIETSADGKYYKRVQDEKIEVVPDEEKVVRTVRVKFVQEFVRYVRVTAVNQKTCPGWHTCNGNPCWIFADEIIVE